MTTFRELNLSDKIMQSVEKMGFEEATPIQAQTIPLAMEGNDIIGQAQTGTGKTAAFGIPLLEKIDINNEHVQAIVIAPTRELALQVSEELYKIASYKRVRVLPIFGGQDMGRQIRSLKKYPHVIVGTPGRIQDHINRKTLRLGNVETLVLDEADEMLNMGFIEDIEAILTEVPEERQTLLFSATMPDQIRKIAERFMTEPKHVRVQAKEVTMPNIAQYFIETPEKNKFDVLTRLLDIQAPELAIIFGRTKRRVDELSEALTMCGYTAEGIHGDLTQARRLQVLKKFKTGSIDVLVATDVAARGLDISGVTHVYNFDIPQDPESYVHRIGRTGRAGKTGAAVSFITPREFGQLKLIEQTTKKKMERLQAPSIDDALESQLRITIDRLNETIEKNNLTYYKRLAGELLDEQDSMTVVAAALKLLVKEPSANDVHLTSEPPVIAKGDKFKRGSSSNNKRGDWKKRSGNSGGRNDRGDRKRSGDRERNRGDRKRSGNFGGKPKGNRGQK